MTVERIDLLLVVTTNLFNLLIAAIMLSRPKGLSKLEHTLGLISTALILPLGMGMVFNLIHVRGWWMVALPGLLILFLGIEYFLDYVLKFDFRSTRWLGPYLLIFYLSQWGMIGYGFGVLPVYGFVTLVTYFVSLGATAYSYASVRHGKKDK